MNWLTVRAILALPIFWTGIVCAQTSSQMFYANCLTQARNELAECRHQSHSGKGCGGEYRHEKDRCWDAYRQMGVNDAGYGWSDGTPRRFEPVPIPQRPVYILPGMK